MHWGARMPTNHRITINPDGYIGQLQKALAGHMSDLRNTLRSIEDGSYAIRARVTRPNAVISFQLPPMGSHNTGDAAASACNGCFLDLVRELITYLDWMIAVQRLIQKKIVAPRAIHGMKEVQDFVGGQLKESYLCVARDASLTNPKKISEFSAIADLARKAALSYFAVRRCLEHRSGASSEELVLYTLKPLICVGGKEITTLPHAVDKGNAISVRMEEDTRTFVPGSIIRLTEADVEGVYFTIQHVIAPEVRRCLGASETLHCK